MQQSHTTQNPHPSNICSVTTKTTLRKTKHCKEKMRNTNQKTSNTLALKLRFLNANQISLHFTLEPIVIFWNDNNFRLQLIANIWTKFTPYLILLRNSCCAKLLFVCVQCCFGRWYWLLLLLGCHCVSGLCLLCSIQSPFYIAES